jgi:hypothetical protein
MKFNGITTGGGGSAATELTDWATRLEGTYSEGDLAVWTATGAYYKWCSALRGGSGDWVRAEAYTSSFGDLAYVDGTETDQAQALTQGWDSIVENGAGTITFDGTHAKVYGNGGNTADYAYFDLRASCPINASGTFYSSGLYTITTIHFANNKYIYPIGVRSRSAPGASTSYLHYLTSIGANVPNIGAIDGGNPVYGSDTEGELGTSTGEKHIAFHGNGYFSVDNRGLQRVWIDHSLTPYIAGLRTYGSSVSVPVFFIYARASDMKVRAFSSGYIS